MAKKKRNEQYEDFVIYMLFLIHLKALDLINSFHFAIWHSFMHRMTTTFDCEWTINAIAIAKAKSVAIVKLYTNTIFILVAYANATTRNIIQIIAIIWCQLNMMSRLYRKRQKHATYFDKYAKLLVVIKCKKREEKRQDRKERKEPKTTSDKYFEFWREIR